MGRSPVKLQIEWVWRGGSTGDEEAMMAGAFDGIRIIELTTMVSGPMACMMLADQGAEVIKIEAPTAVESSNWLSGSARCLWKRWSSAEQGRTRMGSQARRPACSAGQDRLSGREMGLETMVEPGGIEPPTS